MLSVAMENPVERPDAISEDEHIAPTGPKESYKTALAAQEKAPSAGDTTENVHSLQRGPQHNHVSIRVDTTPTEVLTVTTTNEDPLELRQHKRPEVSTKQLKEDYPEAKARRMKKFYTRQNALIDQFLQSGDEERLAALDMEQNGPKIKFAIYGSASVNFCLFIIQLYAAVTTGSLSLFATAADAFVSAWL
jgi:hypothetical protein